MRAPERPRITGMGERNQYSFADRPYVRKRTARLEAVPRKCSLTTGGWAGPRRHRRHLRILRFVPAWFYFGDSALNCLAHRTSFSHNLKAIKCTVTEIKLAFGFGG
jgi:hypothetical protein